MFMSMFVLVTLVHGHKLNVTLEAFEFCD